MLYLKRIPAIIILFSFILLVCFTCFGYRINGTNSLPKGLYRKVHKTPEKGDIVVFCLRNQEEIVELARSRHYLKTGKCPGGITAFGKMIYGMPGDVITFDHERHIVVNGNTLEFSAPKKIDSRGRIMPMPKLEEMTIPAGKFLPLTHCRGSFDGRYFGLADLNDVYVVRPIFTLKNRYCISEKDA